MEHRCGTRYAADVRVYIRTEDGLVSSTGRLCELSVSGGFVRTALPVQPLCCVLVQLLIAPSSAARLFLEGQVVRRSPLGLAIEWDACPVELVRDLASRALPLSPEIPARGRDDWSTETHSSSRTRPDPRY